MCKIRVFLSKGKLKTMESIEKKFMCLSKAILLCSKIAITYNILKFKKAKQKF